MKMEKLSTADVSHSHPFAGWSIEHVGLRVPDFESAAAWYAEKLGFRQTGSFSHGEKTYGFLSSRGEGGCLIELVAGPGAEDRPSYRDLPESHGLAGWHHLCIRVQDVHETVAELRRRGVSIVSEPRDVPALGRRFAFFADPWGNLFEVSQPV